LSRVTLFYAFRSVIFFPTPSLSALESLRTHFRLLPMTQSTADVARLAQADPSAVIAYTF